MEKSNKITKQFGTIALIEGWSFIILLFIAMPLKYFAGFPLAVKYVGWAHGVLFVAYMIMLLRCAIENSWKLSMIAWAFIAAFIPFATFVLDRQLKRLV